MIPIHVAAIAEELLRGGLTTNNETQALKWALQITREMEKRGFKFEYEAPLPTGKGELAPA